ncbi:DUF1310 family protein [Streptococcus acidominimus]|uniref:Membrane protein n=1 Tax=Streptococcus acidominimus TaxID=1326 RepID=A0A1Q8E5S4_STRAI|nr:DUF1310 family protein [Streptococcus acidominimus]OLF47146.1 hypothetical protein BU200_10325 [Streptococcus acidominimus]SUN08131.1 membrane protein [Streptococcus acidominimus]
MKSWQKWLLGLIASIAVVIGIGVLEQMNKQEQLKQEMIKVVESEEVKQVIEEGLRNLDSKALTAQGKIQSYKIDLESIRHNPMGGIDVSIVMNDDKELYISYTLNKDVNSNQFLPGGAIISEKLSDILNGRD